jgi:hypothetical protein
MHSVTRKSASGLSAMCMAHKLRANARKVSGAVMKAGSNDEGDRLSRA